MARSDNKDAAVKTADEKLLIKAVCAYAKKHELACKTVPMSIGAEPRIGLGFQPSGNLRKVAARLSVTKRSPSVRAYSRLHPAEAQAFGRSKPAASRSMHSMTTLPWPLPPGLLEQFLDASFRVTRDVCS